MKVHPAFFPLALTALWADYMAAVLLLAAEMQINGPHRRRPEYLRLVVDNTTEAWDDGRA